MDAMRERINTIRAVHARLTQAGQLRAQGQGRTWTDIGVLSRLQGRLTCLLTGSAPIQMSPAPTPAKADKPKRKRAQAGRGQSFKRRSGRVVVAELDLPLALAALRSLRGKCAVVGVASLGKRLHARYGCEECAPLALAARLRQLGVPVMSGPWPRVCYADPDVRRLLEEV